MEDYSMKVHLDKTWIYHNLQYIKSFSEEFTTDRINYSYQNHIIHKNTYFKQLSIKFVPNTKVKYCREK